MGRRGKRRAVSRITRNASAVLLLSILAAACSETATSTENPASGPPGATDDPTTPPPEQCKTPGALPEGGWFTDITEESGLADVQAIRASSVDINGDGLPDLVVHYTAAKRDSVEAPMRRVFLNEGGGHFKEITAESGLLDSRDGAQTGRLGHLAVFADVDNDGDLDLFEGSYIDTGTDPAAEKDKSEIFLNDGTGHFSIGPRSSPGKVGMPTSSASFADFDRDGKIDLFVGTFYDGAEGGGNQLHKGNGDGTFVDVSEKSKVLRPATDGAQDAWLRGDNRKPAYGITTCDADDDGNPDLIVSAYGRSWNELWKNDGNGTFTEVGIGTPFAADELMSFKQDNEFFHCWCSENANMCTEDESKPKVGCDRYSWQPGMDDQPARNAGNTFTTACADLDNDGDLDFIHSEIRHWHIGMSSDTSQIIKNKLENGKLAFERLPNDDKTLYRKPNIPDWNEGDMDVGAMDFDNDGKKDIWLSSSDYPDTWGALFHQKSDGTFENATVASGIKHYHAHGFAAVDIDGDGDLDLIVTTSPARCQGDANCPAKATLKVYRNDIGSKSNFTKIRLHGKGEGFANAAAIGAKVTVVSGGTRQVQEVGGGYGHFGMQHDTVLNFGLGATCKIDAIEVRWPNGELTKQSFEGVVANYFVDITEGDAKPKYIRK
jgi:enediyne biosynthesis protein E4